MSTFTPVALLKASISLTKASSSDCTKYFQRSIDSLAPFSGFHGALCAQAFAQSSSAGPVSTPAAPSAVPPFTKARRVYIVMIASSVGLIVAHDLFRKPVPSTDQVRGQAFRDHALRTETFSRLGIEQMHETRIGLEPDLVARLECMALAKHRDHLLVAELGDDLNFRAGRLDHLDLRRRAVLGERKMLGPDPAGDGAAIPGSPRGGARPPGAAGAAGGRRPRAEPSGAAAPWARAVRLIKFIAGEPMKRER